MWTDAWAQAAGGGAQNSTVTILLTMLQFLPIFLIIYFLIIRPQQKRQKTLEKMLAALQKGDKVLTNGGIYGSVVGVDGPKVVLRIGDDIKVEFAKSSIVQVIAEDAK